MPILKQFLKILEKKYIYFQKYNKNLLVIERKKKEKFWNEI